MSAIGEALSEELHKTRSHNTAKAKIVMKPDEEEEEEEEEEKKNKKVKVKI